MQRIQFPLRLAYALSYNKAQGQEFQKLGADITHPSFSHGHLYVALSRIRLSTNIKFFITDENLIDGIPYTDNVVYNEIINSFDNF
jgi:formamidopyrimidine-DNA glycosylase